MAKGKAVPCSLHIGNVGFVGDFASVNEAKKQAADWFKVSIRADREGSYICDREGNPLHEWGRRSKASVCLNCGHVHSRGKAK